MDMKPGLVVAALAIAIAIPILGAGFDVPVFREIYHWQQWASWFVRPGF